jgi:phosphatidylglycerophosphatase A
MSLSPLPRGRFDFAMALATWFGCGFAPVGPGTVGSLAALAIAIWLGHPAILAAVVIGPGVWAADVTAKRMKLKDPGIVVVDEVIGQWITLAGATAFNWKSWLGCLLLFRLFDIWKPFPIRKLEALPGGVGIVADDVLAGLYGALVIFVVGRFHLY